MRLRDPIPSLTGTPAEVGSLSTGFKLFEPSAGKSPETLVPRGSVSRFFVVPGSILQKSCDSGTLRSVMGPSVLWTRPHTSLTECVQASEP